MYWHNRSMEVERIIRPLPSSVYQADFAWCRMDSGLHDMGYGPVDFEPEFQRGHVWTGDQQTAWMENVLRGVIPSSGLVVQFNCPNWETKIEDPTKYEGELPAGLQCIDGLQRITAARHFLEGHIKPFGLHVDDLKGTPFQADRYRYRFSVAVYNFTKRSEILQHYLDLNTGGTVHSPFEIERVARMLSKEKDK